MNIHQAAQRGDKAELLRNLKAGIPVDSRNEYRATPLMLAALSPKADLSILRLLAEHGADVNASGAYGFTPISGARRDADKARFLLERGADPTARVHGSNLVFPGVPHDLTRQFLELGVDPKADPDNCNSALDEASRVYDWKRIALFYEYGCGPADLGWSRLMNAIVFGSTADVAAELFEPEALITRDSWDRGPFLLCACVGDTAKASLLLEAGANMEEKGRCDRTCLHYAAESGQLDMIDWLLSRGVEVDVKDDTGRTPLFISAEAGQADATQRLIDRGAKVDHQSRWDIQAISGASTPEVVEILHKAGADLNHVDSTGYFPFITALEVNNDDVVKALIRLGANVNTRAGNFGTALNCAVNGDNLEIIRLLLAAGADPNIGETDGWKALWYVKSIEAAKMLLDAGADLTLTDYLGRTALERHRDNAEIRDFLRQAASA